MKTPHELQRANAGQAAKFLSDESADYQLEHLRAALINAMRRIDTLERRVDLLKTGEERPEMVSMSGNTFRR